MGGRLATTRVPFDDIAPPVRPRLCASFTVENRTAAVTNVPVAFADSVTDVPEIADIVVPNGASVTLDGVLQLGVPVAIGTSGLGTLRVKLGAGNLGAHTLTGTQPVGLQVMGYGSYTSYQYPGGLDLNLISGKPKDAP